MAGPGVISLRPHEAVIIAAVQRRALNEAAAATLSAEVVAAAEAAPSQPVILDMSKVDFVPSVALGALVKLMQVLKLDGHRLVLAAVHPRVMGTLMVTRLHKLLEIRHSVEDALAYLQAAP